MLVQCLLRRSLNSSDYLGPSLDMDGIYGPATDYWLCRFLINKIVVPRDVLPNYMPKDGNIVEPIPYTAPGVGMWANAMTELGGIKEVDFQIMLKTMPQVLQKELEKNTKFF